MQRQTVQVGQGLAGTERYGTIHGTEVRQLIPAHIQPGVEPASPSGTKYGIVSQCEYIKEDGEQCMAPRKKTSKYCFGHNRRIEKLEEEALAKETPADKQE